MSFLRVLRRYSDSSSLCLLLLVAFSGALLSALSGSLLEVSPLKVSEGFSKQYTLAIAKPGGHISLSSPGSRFSQGDFELIEQSLGSVSRVYASAPWRTKATSASDPESAKNVAVLLGVRAADLPLIGGRMFRADELACVARGRVDQLPLNLGNAFAPIVGTLSADFVGLELDAKDYYCSSEVGRTLGLATGRSADHLSRIPLYSVYLASNLPRAVLVQRLRDIALRQSPDASLENRRSIRLVSGWISNLASKQSLQKQTAALRVLAVCYLFFILCSVALIHFSRIQEQRAVLEIKRMFGARSQDLLRAGLAPLLVALLIALVCFSVGFFWLREVWARQQGIELGLPLYQSFGWQSWQRGVATAGLMAAALVGLKLVLTARVLRGLRFSRQRLLISKPKTLILCSFLAVSCISIGLALSQLRHARIPDQASFGIGSHATQPLAIGIPRSATQMELPFVRSEIQAAGLWHQAVGAAWIDEILLGNASSWAELSRADRKCGDSALVGVTPNFQALVGLSLSGRMPLSANEIVIDTKIARRCFGSDSVQKIVGQTLRHGGIDRTVVGIHEPIDLSFGRGEQLGEVLTLFGENFNASLLLRADQRTQKGIEAALSKQRGHRISVQLNPVSSLINQRLSNSVLFARLLMLAWSILAALAAAAFVLYSEQQIARIRPAVALQVALGATRSKLAGYLYRSFVIALAGSIALILAAAFCLPTVGGFSAQEIQLPDFYSSAFASLVLGLVWLVFRILALSSQSNLPNEIRGDH